MTGRRCVHIIIAAHIIKDSTTPTFAPPQPPAAAAPPCSRLPCCCRHRPPPPPSASPAFCASLPAGGHGVMQHANACILCNWASSIQGDGHTGRHAPGCAQRQATTGRLQPPGSSPESTPLSAASAQALGTRCVRSPQQGPAPAQASARVCSHIEHMRSSMTWGEPVSVCKAARRREQAGGQRMRAEGEDVGKGARGAGRG